MQLTIRRRPADLIWQWRRITYAVSALLAFLAVGGVFISVSDPSSTIPLSTAPTFLESSRAFRTAQDLAARYPYRPLGSDEARNASQWYEARLAELKIPSYTQEFVEPWGTGEVTLRNVVVVLPGQTNEAILVSAPRDTPSPGAQTTGETEAADMRPTLATAAGTATLLDLIQVFAARPHEKTLIFLSSEGGAAGGLGVARFLDEDPRGADARVVLSMYGLGREQREALQAGVTGRDVSTPGWFVQLVAAALGESDLGLHLPDLPDQIADHALRLARGEQVAGLMRGIPSLLLYDEGPGEVTSAGLGTQGAIVERIILSLDAGTAVPADPGTALVLPSGRYFTSRSLSVLGWLMLLPAVMMALTWLAITRIRPETWLRYVRNLASFALPLLVMLPVVWAAGWAGLLPLYPPQSGPPTAAANGVDPLTTAALVAAGVVLFVSSRHYLGHLRPREPLVLSETIKLSLGLIAVVGGMALLVTHSPFSVLTGITAAWVWPLATCFAEPRSTALPGRGHARSNRPLLLIGLTAPFLLYVYLVFSTPLHWWQGWWFLLVQAASGTYGVRGPVALALLAAAFMQLLGVKRLRLRPIETLEQRAELPTAPPAPPRVRKVRTPRPPDGRASEGTRGP